MAGNVGLGDDSTIPELMDFLKTGFQPRHFDQVQKILINREKKLKIEIERLKEEIRLNEELKKRKFGEMHRGMAIGTVPGNGNSSSARVKVETDVSDLNDTTVPGNGNSSSARVKVETDVPDLNDTVPGNGNSSSARVKIEVDESHPIKAELLPVKIETNCNDIVPENGNSSLSRVKTEVLSPKAEFDNSQEEGSEGEGHRDDDFDWDYCYGGLTATDSEDERAEWRGVYEEYYSL